MMILTCRYRTRFIAAVILASVVHPAMGVPLKMPGKSYDGASPPLSAAELQLRDRLRAHVYRLSSEIGERNWPNYDALEQAGRYIEQQLRESGYHVRRRPFQFKGEIFHNVEGVLAEVEDDAPTVVIGAHYDSVEGSPGANDNASGVASVLELARVLRARQLPLPVRFVAFVNEEPPYFNTRQGMGSVEYIRSFVRPKDSIRAMLSIETVGMYSDAPGSQKYPPVIGMLYPDRGNFIGFVGDLSSRALVRRAIGSFRRVATLPSEGAVLPSAIPGISWSDHRSFSEAGIPAAMVTDTAPFRDLHYHRSTDTPERLDYDKMARLVVGLVEVVADLAQSNQQSTTGEPKKGQAEHQVPRDAIKDTHQ